MGHPVLLLVLGGLLGAAIDTCPGPGTCPGPAGNAEDEDTSLLARRLVVPKVISKAPTPSSDLCALKEGDAPLCRESAPTFTPDLQIPGFKVGDTCGKMQFFCTLPDGNGGKEHVRRSCCTCAPMFCKTGKKFVPDKQVPHWPKGRLCVDQMSWACTAGDDNGGKRYLQDVCCEDEAPTCAPTFCKTGEFVPEKPVPNVPGQFCGEALNWACTAKDHDDPRYIHLQKECCALTRTCAPTFCETGKFLPDKQVPDWEKGQLCGEVLNWEICNAKSHDKRKIHLKKECCEAPAPTCAPTFCGTGKFLPNKQVPGWEEGQLCGEVLSWEICKAKSHDTRKIHLKKECCEVSGTTPISPGCYNITDRQQCCRHHDARDFYQNDKCVPAADKQQFTSGRVCEPECWTKGTCTGVKQGSDRVGTCASSKEKEEKKKG